MGFIEWLRLFVGRPKRRAFAMPAPLTRTFCDHAPGPDGRCWFCGER